MYVAIAPAAIVMMKNRPILLPIVTLAFPFSVSIKKARGYLLRLKIIIR